MKMKILQLNAHAHLNHFRSILLFLFDNYDHERKLKQKM